MLSKARLMKMAAQVSLPGALMLCDSFVIKLRPSLDLKIRKRSCSKAGPGASGAWGILVIVGKGTLEVPRYLLPRQ